MDFVNDPLDLFAAIAQDVERAGEHYSAYCFVVALLDETVDLLENGCFYTLLQRQIAISTKSTRSHGTRVVQTEDELLIISFGRLLSLFLLLLLFLEGLEVLDQVEHIIGLLLDLDSALTYLQFVLLPTELTDPDSIFIYLGVDVEHC